MKAGVGSDDPNTTLINGDWSDKVAVLDRGLQYGDGLFETLPVVNGQAQHWDAHFDRLARGCDRLRIPTPKREVLAEETDRICAGVERGVLKIVVTRGRGARGYRSPHTVLPTRVVTIFPWPNHPQRNVADGVLVRICSTRLARNPALAGIKHLNRLEQVLARNEWDDPDIAEGLMLDTEHHVVAGTMSNLFLVKDGILFTPDLSHCGITGIMRNLVQTAAAKLDIEVCIKWFTIDELHFADEVFLSNSLIGIWSVRKLIGVKAREPYRGDMARLLRDALYAEALLPRI